MTELLFSVIVAPVGRPSALLVKPVVTPSVVASVPRRPMMSARTGSTPGPARKAFVPRFPLAKVIVTTCSGLWCGRRPSQRSTLASMTARCAAVMFGLYTG